MKNTKQLWKYTWNPQGYLETDIKVDLSKKYKNNTFYLPHTFFHIKDFKLYSLQANGNKKFYNCHETLKDTTDFLFVNKDEDLSKLASIPIYSRVKLISNRVISLTEVFCDCYFVADVIDSALFNQELHQTAEVEHKSLTLSEVLVAPVAEVLSLQGDWGTINKDKIELHAETSINNISIEDSGILMKPSEKNIRFGEENFNVEFDKKTKNAFLSVGAKRKGVMFRGPQEISEIPVVGIPVILSDDRTRFSFVPWLTLDPNNKGIQVGAVNINNSTIITENEMLFAMNKDTFSIKLDTHDFLLYNKKNSLVSFFNGLIKVDLLNKKVSIQDFVIDSNFVTTFNQMKLDIQELKKKIK